MYNQLASVHRLLGNDNRAMAILQEGFAKFPEDFDLRTAIDRIEAYPTPPKPFNAKGFVILLGFICLFGGFIMVPMMGNRIVSEQVGAIGGMVFFFGILLLVIGFKMDKSV